MLAPAACNLLSLWHILLSLLLLIAYLLPVACISQCYTPPRFGDRLVRPSSDLLEPPASGYFLPLLPITLLFSTSPLQSLASILSRPATSSLCIPHSLVAVRVPAAPFSYNRKSPLSYPIPSCRHHLALPLVDPAALAGFWSTFVRSS
jgi:hypothetical protein